MPPTASVNPVANQPDFVFSGEIPPRKIPASYRWALVLSATAIVLLPLIYVGLIILAGYSVYWYGVHATVLFQDSSGGFARLLLYYGPQIAGAVLVAFLIKPLFARDARHAEPLSLDLKDEPRLRSFISEICRHVGAPIPIRVDLDTQVNASARFDRGLRSLGRRELVLTIGLPLAAGLTTRQFAGVLAHEFGHFAQGAGMAATYIVRSVNGWFSRVVFGRDSWDAKLEEWSRTTDFRIAAFLWLARGGVWLSRKVLHGLMYAAHAVTCIQLRQMEFDADYYETQLAGSRTFRETSHELRRLNLAGQRAYNELGTLWQERRLVSDFAELVTLRRSQFPSSLNAEIEAAVTGTKTRWSDTHPSDADRIAHAEGLAAKGIFEGEDRASTLFSDFAKTSLEVTKHFYRAQLQLSFNDDALIPVSAAAATSDSTAAALDAVRRLGFGIIDIFRSTAWPTPMLSALGSEETPESLAGRLVTLRKELSGKAKEGARTQAIFEETCEKFYTTNVAYTFLAAGIRVEPKAFDLSKSDVDEAASKRDQLKRDLGIQGSGFGEFEVLFWRYLELIARATKTPTMHSSRNPSQTQRLSSIVDCLSPCRSIVRLVPNWIVECRIFEAFRANQASFGDDQKFRLCMGALRSRLGKIVEQAESLATDAIFPLTSDGTPVRLSEVLSKSAEGLDPDARYSTELTTFLSCYFRLLGELAIAGEQMEKVAACAPGEGPNSC